jgi:predicted Zn-dependent peptidase
MSCGVWVKQGSKHEDDSNNGRSHLIEHLMINKDNHLNPRFQKLISSVAAEGVLYNAGTTKESTSFHFTGLTETLDSCLKTLASIAIDNRTFTGELIENEKKVVTQEAISFYSSFNQIKERASQALWGDIGVGKIIVGNIENIKNADNVVLENIILGSYTPENSVLLIIGDIEYHETLNMIVRYFSRWKDTHTREYNEIVQGEPGIYYNSGNGGKSTVISVGFRTPGYMTKDRVYIEIASKIIGDSGLDSRLAQEVRMKRGLAYNLGSFTNFYENRGSFAFTSVCSKESVEELIKVVVDEFNKAKSKGFTLDEMEKAKKVLKTNRLLELGDLTSQLKFLGKCATYGHLYSLEQELRNIDKVDCDTLNRVIKDTIREESLALAIIGECDIDNIIPLLKVN